MRITEDTSDATIIQELGTRLAARRLLLNLTQAELGDRAGVDRKSIVRAEAGGAVRLEIFIRILRALDLVDGLERLVPEPQLSPMEQLALQGRRRKRATGRRGAATSPADGGFRWGDEQVDD